MQEGLAVLEIAPMVEFTNSRNVNVERRNAVHGVSRGKLDLHSKTNSPQEENPNSQSNFQSKKGTYETKPIRTTKNFIGKPFYNVGHPRIALLIESFASRKMVPLV